MHRYLEKHFPDLTERMEYQEKQEKLYESAMKKKREIKMLENSNLFTNEELDAIGYFEGTRKYAKHQDPSTPPNIFDRRQTLLLKMQDWHVQEKYLNSFQKYN